MVGARRTLNRVGLLRRNHSSSFCLLAVMMLLLFNFPEKRQKQTAVFLFFFFPLPPALEISMKRERKEAVQSFTLSGTWTRLPPQEEGERAGNPNGRPGPRSRHSIAKAGRQETSMAQKRTLRSLSRNNSRFVSWSTCMEKKSSSGGLSYWQTKLALIINRDKGEQFCVKITWRWLIHPFFRSVRLLRTVYCLLFTHISTLQGSRVFLFCTKRL